MTNEEREVIEAAKHYVKVQGNPNLSPYIKENGRHGKLGPWGELRLAVENLNSQ